MARFSADVPKSRSSANKACTEISSSLPFLQGRMREILRVPPSGAILDWTFTSLKAGVRRVECTWTAGEARPKCAHGSWCHLRGTRPSLLLSQPQRRGQAAGKYPGLWWEHACAETQAAGDGKPSRRKWWLYAPLVSSVAMEAEVVCRAGHWEPSWFLLWG